jgi:hypothetical protein
MTAGTSGRLSSHQASPRRVAIAVGAVALAVVLGACGGGGGGGKQVGVAQIGTTTTDRTVAVTSTRATPAAPAALVSQLERYASCMRSHGIADFPDPSASKDAIKVVLPPGITGSPKFSAARRACRGLLPQGPPSENITPSEEADYLKAASCMRAHGIVGFPDPKFAGGNVSFPLPAGMDANTVRFRRAREICEMLIPAGLPYSKEAEGGQ